MSTLSPVIKMLLYLLIIQVCSTAVAQEKSYKVLHVMDMPPGLYPESTASCSLKFQEQWILDIDASSIRKEVDTCQSFCPDSSLAPDLPGGTIRLNELSIEFSFMDLANPDDMKIQEVFIALINDIRPIPEVYNPKEQLLSVCFHEDWIIDTDHRVFKKKIRGITPVIWQIRQTADGETIPDPETGYPVYYKLKLERIELRSP